MTRTELKDKLDFLGINKNQYSLHGDLFPDRIILFKNYNNWEVFYFDEKGIPQDKRIFNNENDACLHILKLFEDAKSVEIEYEINT